MPIEFTVRSEDLRRAVRQVQVTRGELANTDFAGVKVWRNSSRYYRHHRQES
jgi:hypothetical protein